MFRSRKSMIAVLLIILLILFVWYGSASPEPEKGHYPGSEHVVQDREAYVGEKVDIGGRVVETDPLTIEVEYGDDSILLEIVNTSKDADVGDRVSVFGTLNENHTITAETMIVRPLTNWYYMYGVSGAAAIWLLVRLISHWKYTPTGFKPREEPLKLFRRDEDG